jgi:hypothetical protein
MHFYAHLFVRNWSKVFIFLYEEQPDEIKSFTELQMRQYIYSISAQIPIVLRIYYNRNVSIKAYV